MDNKLFKGPLGGLFALGIALLLIWFFFFVLIPLLFKILAGLLFYTAMGIIAICVVIFVIKLLVD